MMKRTLLILLIFLFMVVGTVFVYYFFFLERNSKVTENNIPEEVDMEVSSGVSVDDGYFSFESEFYRDLEGLLDSNSNFYEEVQGEYGFVQ